MVTAVSVGIVLAALLFMQRMHPSSAKLISEEHHALKLKFLRIMIYEVAASFLCG